MTAKAVARNMSRWINTQGCRHTLVCASTHDDIMESLRPDVLVWKGLGEQVEVVPRDGLRRE
jgi:ABC-type ATPase with predicted acetyltransferase domain